MVTSRRPSKPATARKVSAGRSRPAARRPQVDASCMATTDEARAGLRETERKLEQIGRATTKLARHWMKEVSTAAQACREPMKSIWHSVARASRSVARDAVTAWNEMTAAAPKAAATGKSRRPAA
jgi:hypothetical protein